jgi:hypothetical protein
MSSPTPDSVRTELEADKMKIGNFVKASTGAYTDASQVLYVDSNKKLAGTAVTASKPVYIDSSSIPQTGAFPFACVITGASNSGMSVLDVTGYSTLSSDQIEHVTLVAGAAASLTTTGFLRISIADSAGNITAGQYYIPYGTLS